MAWRPRALSIVGSALFVAPLAFAQSSREQADALFKEGRAAAQAGDYVTACAKFTASQKLDPSTGTLLNLGDCEEQQRHLIVARNYYQDALRQLGATDPRVVPAKERLASLESRIPRLTIRVPTTAPPRTTASLDGVPVQAASLEAPMPLDPGKHTLVVSAPGHEERRMIVDIAETQSLELVAQAGPEPRVPAPAPAPAPPPEPAAPPPRAHTATLGWIVGGVGLAGLALAGVSGAIVASEKSTVDRHCPQGKTSCDAEGASAATANRTWLPVNTVSWIVGVLGVGVGAYLVLTSGPAKASLGARALPGGGALDARVSF